MKATRQVSIRRAAIGAVLGIGAVALIAPVIASGGALNTVGSNAQAMAVARPFTASLNGANEFPGPGDTDGTGAAAITINPTTGEICADLRVENIATPTAAHIHRGAAGVAGGIEVTLTTPTPLAGSTTIFTSQACATATPVLAAEIAGAPAGFYVNVHTGDFAAGAVRGQLAAGTTKSGDIQLLAEPVRVYDSREGTLTPIAPNETRTISLTSGKNGAGATVMALPPGATAAMVRLTLDGAVGAGFLTIYSAALPAQPATSSLNWYETGAIGGADATVVVDAAGRVKVGAGGNTTDFIIDVVGYVF